MNVLVHLAILACFYWICAFVVTLMRGEQHLAPGGGKMANSGKGFFPPLHKSEEASFLLKFSVREPQIFCPSFESQKQIIGAHHCNWSLTIGHTINRL